MALRVQVQLLLLQPHQLVPDRGLLLLHFLLLPQEGGLLLLQLLAPQGRGRQGAARSEAGQPYAGEGAEPGRGGGHQVL